MLRTLTLISVMLLLAACGAPMEEENLPTLAQFPVSTPEEAADARATLPPTWTQSPEPSETPSVTPSLTETVTVTPSLTDTARPTLPPTPVPPTEPRPITDLLSAALEATVLPQDFAVPQYEGPNVTLPTATAEGIALPPPGVPLLPGCQYFPSGGFATVFMGDPLLASQLGCPIGFPPTTASVSAASQIFERGLMIWLEGLPSQIYVLYSTGSYQVYADTYNPATDPHSGGENPPQGLQEPVRGFGKVWRSFPSVRGTLGWAAGGESGSTATTQSFDNGLMIWLPARGDILVLLTNPDGISGTWRSVPGQF